MLKISNINILLLLLGVMNQTISMCIKMDPKVKKKYLINKDKIQNRLGEKKSCFQTMLKIILHTVGLKGFLFLDRNRLLTDWKSELYRLKRNGQGPLW